MDQASLHLPPSIFLVNASVAFTTHLLFLLHISDCCHHAAPIFGFWLSLTSLCISVRRVKRLRRTTLLLNWVVGNTFLWQLLFAGPGAKRRFFAYTFSRSFRWLHLHLSFFLFPLFLCSLSIDLLLSSSSLLTSAFLFHSLILLLCHHSSLLPSFWSLSGDIRKGAGTYYHSSA